MCNFWTAVFMTRKGTVWFHGERKYLVMYYAGPPQEIRQARPVWCGCLWCGLAFQKIGRGGPAMLLNMYSIILYTFNNKPDWGGRRTTLHSEHNKCWFTLRGDSCHSFDGTFNPLPKKVHFNIFYLRECLHTSFY